MSLRAVLFDYGHTLIDFTVPEDGLHEVYGEIRQRLVAEAGDELPQASELVARVAREVTRRVEESYLSDRLIELDILALFEGALSGLGFVPHSDTVCWVAESEHIALTRFLRCSPETIDTLGHIHDAGLKVGIISNAHLLPYMMRRDWQSLGIAPFVDASLVSSEVGIRKPHPDVFRHVLRELDVAPEEAVFVGDRLLDDVGGAHAVGMQAILTREFRQEDVEPEGELPELVVDRLSDILPYVLSQVATTVSDASAR
jgi:putative hydrolase of the HAD superfamily